MNLVFIIAIYQRHDLTKIVLDYYLKLSKKYGFKIVVAGSEGVISKKLAKGCIYIEAENNPLTFKNNAMLEKAKELKPDAVVLLGSDDLICENVIKYYYELIKQKETKVMGFQDLFFYSTEHKITSHYTSGKFLGAGRFFPKSVLENTDYQGWRHPLNVGCDNENQRFFKTFGIKFENIHLNKIDGFLIDIKHDYNISDKNIIFVGKEINFEIMARKLNKEVAEKIENLNFTPKAVASDLVKFVGNGVNESLGVRTFNIDKKKADLFVKKGWGNYES